MLSLDVFYEDILFTWFALLLFVLNAHMWKLFLSDILPFDFIFLFKVILILLAVKVCDWFQCVIVIILLILENFGFEHAIFHWQFVIFGGQKVIYCFQFPDFFLLSLLLLLQFFDFSLEFFLIFRLLHWRWLILNFDFFHWFALFSFIGSQWPWKNCLHLLKRSSEETILGLEFNFEFVWKLVKFFCHHQTILFICLL